MMEIPLSLLPLLGAIGFYDIQKPKQFSVDNSIVLIGLGGLVKGPVSLAMGYEPWVIWFYLLKFQQQNILKSLHNRFWFSFSFIYLVPSLLSKLWNGFYQLFFLRENMGKFGQASSMSH